MVEESAGSSRTPSGRGGTRWDAPGLTRSQRATQGRRGPDGELAGMARIRQDSLVLGLGLEYCPVEPAIGSSGSSGERFYFNVHITIPVKIPKISVGTNVQCIST